MKSTEMWPPDVWAPKPSYVTKRRASGTPCWISACMHADARKYASWSMISFTCSVRSACRKSASAFGAARAAPVSPCTSR